MSYLDIVEDVLLGLIRASQEGNWLLHLHAIQQTIPWCFAYDKVNYARHQPVYYAEMMNLLSEHPDVYGNFMAENFAVHLAEKSPFGRIPVAKDTKTSGGVKNFQSEDRSCEQVLYDGRRQMLFPCPSEINASQDPMKLKKPKTFSSLSETRNVTGDGQTMILKASYFLFGRIIILGQNRRIEVRELLHYSLSPLPWARATPDGFPWKTTIIHVKLDVNNYTPISLLNISSKILERVVCRSFGNHLTSHSLLSDRQWGFRKGHSTESLLLHLTEMWKEALDDGLKVGVLFSDFRKVFDCVDHVVLGEKLKALGVSEDMWIWRMDYLAN